MMQRGIQLVDAFILVLEAHGKLQDYCSSFDDVYQHLKLTPPIVWADPSSISAPTYYGEHEWSTVDREWKLGLRELTQSRMEEI